MRIEGVVLKHHGHVAIARAHVVDDLAADLDLAFGDLLEAGDRAKQRALAATGGANQNGEFAIGYVEVDTPHGGEGAVILVQATDLHFGHFKFP